MENLNQKEEIINQEEVATEVAAQQEEAVEEVREVEMRSGLLVGGTGQEINWEVNYDVAPYTNVLNHVLTLTYQDTGESDTVRCGVYKDGEDKFYTVIETSAEALTTKHANFMISSLLTVLRNETALNDNVIENGGIEEFEAIYYLIDAITKLHTVTNIIEHEQ